jgi:hypothetical protein
MQELGMQQSMSAVQSCPPIKQQTGTNPPLSAQSTVSPPPRHCATYEHCAARGNPVGAAVQPTTGVVSISIAEHWPISAHALAGVPSRASTLESPPRTRARSAAPAPAPGRPRPLTEGVSRLAIAVDVTQRGVDGNGLPPNSRQSAPQALSITRHRRCLRRR